jgi:hypothetical protein
MTIRRAACHCGRLALACEAIASNVKGEPAASLARKLGFAGKT